MLAKTMTEGQRLYLTKVLGIEYWIRPPQEDQSYTPTTHSTTEVERTP